MSTLSSQPIREDIVGDLQATIFEHYDYGGRSAQLGPGHYSGAELDPVGRKTISSVKVPSGLEVTLYEGDGFTGRYRTITADTPKVDPFNDLTSSIRVVARPASTLVAQGRDLAVPALVTGDDLKMRIARDPELIRRLADLADMIGFGWCGGTQYDWVGWGFDVVQETSQVSPSATAVPTGNVVIKARFNPDDPYVRGPMEGTRLSMTLSNFRVLIDPSTMTLAAPLVTSLEPATIGYTTAKNESDGEDTLAKAFAYQLQTAVTHTTSYSFTEGTKVSISAKTSVGSDDVVKVEITAGFEFNFSATQGWSDATQTTTGQTLTETYTAKIPAHTQRQISLVATVTSAEATYSATAVVAFDVTFSGFLRWAGNARSDHPQDRPLASLTFGTPTMSAFEHIVDSYTRRADTTGATWDWTWIEAETGANGRLADAVDWFRNRIVVPLSGKFSGVGGTSAWITAGPAVALDAPVAAPAVSSKAGKIVSIR